MNDQAAFVKLVEVLDPWRSKLVFVGGWAHRLYRLHSMAEVPAYQPLVTRDADVAFAEGERLEGSIKAQLLEHGFTEHLTGQHRPPVSKYTMGEEGAGFYAEFLTPLTGSGLRRTGEQFVTVQAAGVTAQRLRHLELLLNQAWTVTLDESWGANAPLQVTIPNPVSFVVQKLLIHSDRPRDKQAQDILYIHDALELFGNELDQLRALWWDQLRDSLHKNQVRDLMEAKNQIFGQLNDSVRNAAAIAQGRDLDPERLRARCLAMLDSILEPRTA